MNENGYPPGVYEVDEFDLDPQAQGVTPIDFGAGARRDSTARPACGRPGVGHQQPGGPQPTGYEWPGSFPQASGPEQHQRQTGSEIPVTGSFPQVGGYERGAGYEQLAGYQLDIDPDGRPGPAPPPLRGRRPTGPGTGSWSVLGASASASTAAPAFAAKGPRLRVDWPNCKAHGLCHELLPEAVGLDEWGYPVVGKTPLSSHLVDDARRAVIACPTLALRLVD